MVKKKKKKSPLFYLLPNHICIFSGYLCIITQFNLCWQHLSVTEQQKKKKSEILPYNPVLIHPSQIQLIIKSLLIKTVLKGDIWLHLDVDFAEFSHVEQT